MQHRSGDYLVLGKTAVLDTLYAMHGKGTSLLLQAHIPQAGLLMHFALPDLLASNAHLSMSSLLTTCASWNVMQLG